MPAACKDHLQTLLSQAPVLLHMRFLADQADQAVITFYSDTRSPAELSRDSMSEYSPPIVLFITAFNDLAAGGTHIFFELALLV